MYKNILVILGFVAACWLSFCLGKSQAKIEYIEKTKEVIKYEKNCAVNLLVKPNVNDDAIIRLFDAGEL